MRSESSRSVQGCGNEKEGSFGAGAVSSVAVHARLRYGFKRHFYNAI